MQKIKKLNFDENEINSSEGNEEREKEINLEEIEFNWETETITLSKDTVEMLNDLKEIFQSMVPEEKEMVDYDFLINVLINNYIESLEDEENEEEID